MAAEGGGMMAVYEFECGACGERFEVQRPMSEHDHLKEQAPTCPKCGKTNTRQLVSVFSCKTPSG
jgi:putative FmdB family regulatory protein